MKPANNAVLSTTVSRRVDPSRPSANEFKKPVNKPQSKGGNRRQLEQHEASLVPVIRSKTPVDIALLSGERLKGVVVIGFDRYSIAIEYGHYRETVFKSAISRIITPIEA